MVDRPTKSATFQRDAREHWFVTLTAEFEMPDVASRVDLERAMEALSDGERAAIGACYYADLSHEEAAVALGMPLGTVKTHVLRAKAKLRARLAVKKEK